MSLSPHVNTIVKGAIYHIRNISKIRKYISESTTEILIHSFVSSKLDFCNSLLFGAQKGDIVKLQSVQNAAPWIIAGLKKPRQNPLKLLLVLVKIVWDLRQNFVRLTILWKPYQLWRRSCRIIDKILCNRTRSYSNSMEC